MAGTERPRGRRRGSKRLEPGARSSGPRGHGEGSEQGTDVNGHECS